MKISETLEYEKTNFLLKICFFIIYLPELILKIKFK
ncbi:hypothetical protein Q787_01800 [Ornithobacterium rhinotracheale H06-030791]|nr:hypothetical protein Q785_01830 [Ornithobacterium rhinotracheale ORT-UMN 88]KGB67869.1 hypothetical protein Q787_01800 [Ornithobacterium rhinotracheale H06-030791]